MTRTLHNYGNGRVDVFPFKKSDFDIMLRICLSIRDHSSKESENYYKWYRNYMILIMGVNTGCRIEVLLQLTPKHIKGGMCRITEFKTGKIMRFELSSEVQKAIDAHINAFEIGENEYLFRSFRHKTRPLTRVRAYKIIVTLASQAGVKYAVGCHSLRKSFGRWIYDETHDIHLVQKMLGHSHPLITQQYICLEENLVNKQRRKNAFGLEKV